MKPAKVDWKKSYWEEANKCSELERDNATLHARVDALETVVHNADTLHRAIAEALGRKDMPNDLLVLTASNLSARVEKLERVREAAKRFLPLVNAVTAPHRHGQPMRKGALDKLSNGHLEVEAALTECEEVGRG